MRGLAKVLESGKLRKDREEVEREEKSLRILATTSALDSTAEHIAALDQLAAFYCSLGQVGLAERALTFLREMVTPNAHGGKPLDLRLAGLYTKGGWYRDAIKPMEGAYAEWRNQFGDDHPAVKRIREALIVIHATLRDLPAVRQHVARALDVERASLMEYHVASDDQDLRSTVDDTSGLLGLVISLGVNPRITDPELRAMIALAVGERQGLTLEQPVRANLALLSSASDQEQLRRRIREGRTKILRESLTPRSQDGNPNVIDIGDISPQGIVRYLDRAQRDLYTEALARAAEQISLADVTSGLPPDACLIMFVAYRQFDVEHSQDAAAQNQDEASQRYFQVSGFYTMVRSVDYKLHVGHDSARPADRYAAVVVSRDHAATVVDLADARSLNELIDKFIREIVDPLRREEISSTDLPSIDHLSRALVKPLWNQIVDYNHVVISPDASLWRMPFEILRTPSGALLLDSHLVSYATSARSVQEWGKAAPASGPPLVIGNPDFGTSNTRRDAIRFRSLPATELEAETVVNELGGVSLLGADARKDRITECRSPRVFHVASHAFSIVDIHRLLGMEPGTITKFTAEDPMLSSGIALAGVNDATTNESRLESILFAHEILDLDLAGTELVVLSCCDSGVGAVSAGHGVHGLRRAFSIAGARSQVVSLWQVPSAETSELMTVFYRLLREGLGRAEALAQAKTAIRRVKANPYYWAAFVLDGEPSPLTMS